jgi:hypothetical protein
MVLLLRSFVLFLRSLLGISDGSGGSRHRRGTKERKKGLLRGVLNHRMQPAGPEFFSLQNPDSYSTFERALLE